MQIGINYPYMVIPNEEEMFEILELFKQLVSSILHFRIQLTDIISSRDNRLLKV